MIDFDLDEPLSCETIAEIVGARCSLVIRLARQGLLETIGTVGGEPMLPRRSVIQLRRMQRLRRDLGVNFTGAAVILELMSRIERQNRQLQGIRDRFSE
jgi:MerR HTH family regulatory protein